MDKKPTSDSFLKAIGCNWKGDFSMSWRGCGKDSYLCRSFVINSRWIDAQKQDIPEESKGKMDEFNFGMNI